MNKKLKQIDFSPIIIFLISPILALLFSFRSQNQKWAKNFFWLFCIFFGYTMIIGSSPDLSLGSDSERYKEWFKDLAKQDISSNNFLELLYSGADEDDAKYLDVVQPLVSFVLSRFTSDYHMLFAVFALIYGYFYSRNIWYLIERIPQKRTILISLFVVAFILVCPIWRINGFRFWTGAQVFLYGVFPFLLERKRKKLWIASLSILVHFSFVLPVIVLYLYVFLGNRINFFFILFIVTTFLQESKVVNLQESFVSLPSIFQSKVKTYVEEDGSEVEMVKESAQVLNWYVKYYGLFLKWIVYLFIIYFFFKGKKDIERNRDLISLFCFSMLFYGFANMANLLPQGVRFYTIGNLLVLFFIIYFGANNHSMGQLIVNRLRIVAIPLLITIIIVSVRGGFDFIGVFTVIGNPFIAPLVENDIPLIDLIK